MEKPQDTTPDELLRRIDELEAMVHALTKRLDKEIKFNADADRINTEIRRLIEKDVENAFERIKNIELKFFPNLANDMAALNKVIGEGDGKAWNPFDRRNT